MKPSCFGIRGTMAGLLVLALAACEPRAPEEPPKAMPEPPQFLLETSTYDQLPGWREDKVAEALPALIRSCDRLLRAPDDREVGRGAVGGTVMDWRAPCAAIADFSGAGSDSGDDAFRNLVEQLFVPFKVMYGDKDTGLFTGYYEAELRGALFPGSGYDTPLYKRPNDLVTVDLRHFDKDLSGKRVAGRVQDGRLVPYHARDEIDNGVIDGANLELLWAADPIDVFFLHIQGSGKVLLPDGSTMRVGFDGSNGLPFVAIGRLLIDEGYVSRANASMQSIREWLRNNPDQATELMQRNPRYIFFRKIEGEGPIGAQGVALTPRRSLAIDPSFMPLGAPVFLDTTWPGSSASNPRPLRRLMVAQDTGSAIKGAVRGDFFWGAGDPALAEAGRMKQRGSYYLLLPKSVAARRATGS
ncbi:murein transglycosylase [Denitrobaculum tricleocarpae]|uniref:peptidoglycan lytic exotransglycosylase n=2 Tax=Denitrobaculum tricleocarpae TaxID=2591009 RepID=A0A545TRZ1_9PROT|nr:murein transglycosylase [Denitrobaculum tricleocarpae]